MAEGGGTVKSDSVFKWAVIENIVIILVVAVLFYTTRSPWVFLLLLLVNMHKHKETGKDEIS